MATGGCLCGSVRYMVDGPVGPAAYCHCTDCRRVTGSAFNVSARVALAGFRIASGALGKFTKRADSGDELTRHFCRDCGSPIYTSSARHADAVYLKAGSLDDPSLIKPVKQNWTASAVDWAVIPNDLLTYQRGG